ncbi:response regulator transcription factor [Bacillus sp. JJ1127]|uniref:response regulator transcription factor n=1 Tax=Bacillus sp. JJ1127 TaxID=3122952 RepID=UPI002FFEA206
MTKKTHILVVEDDNDINQLLCNIIKKNGYSPQPAFSGTEAVIYIEKQDWQLILLDLMLPGMDGERILEKISDTKQTPVIIISAKGELQTKISALRGGADDFITKPFDIEEVSARIESHLRRYNRLKEPIFTNRLQYKDIHLDMDTKAVYVNHSLLSLTAKEYAILELLMSYPKKVFTKMNLFENVWGENFLGDDNAINVHLSHLRKKLTEANPDGDYIETIWGMGYRLK